MPGDRFSCRRLVLIEDGVASKTTKPCSRSAAAEGVMMINERGAQHHCRSSQAARRTREPRLHGRCHHCQGRIRVLGRTGRSSPSVPRYSQPGLHESTTRREAACRPPSSFAPAFPGNSSRHRDPRAAEAGPAWMVDGAHGSPLHRPSVRGRSTRGRAYWETA